MEEEYKNKISYSQYSLWSQCPHRWKVIYIDKKRIDEPGIELIFGSAIHHTLQAYLTALYSNGVKFADSMELKDILREYMGNEYRKLKEIYGESLDNKITKNDMLKFYYDGIKILDGFLKHRRDYFNYRDEELIGVEVPIEYSLRENLNFVAYLDVVLRNKVTGKIRIVDFKTSRRGWKYQKNDENKTSQLVIYKSFYSEKFKVDLKDIDVEFIILKRELYEDSPYPQKRIQRFVPASGKPTVNKTMQNFNRFLNTCFDSVGNCVSGIVYPKIATENNCRYCEFNQVPELCDKKN